MLSSWTLSSILVQSAGRRGCDSLCRRCHGREPKRGLRAIREPGDPRWVCVTCVTSVCVCVTSMRCYPLVNWHNYGKSPFFIGKSTISMAIFNSYASLPEGIFVNMGCSPFSPSIEWFLLGDIMRYRKNEPFSIATGGLEHEFYDFPIILGISSSQLKKSIIFQRGRLNHQPVYLSQWIYLGIHH